METLIAIKGIWGIIMSSITLLFLISGIISKLKEKYNGKVIQS